MKAVEDWSEGSGERRCGIMERRGEEGRKHKGTVERKVCS